MMAIAMGFIEDSHPVLTFILRLTGYIHCQRNARDQYYVNDRGLLFSAAMIIFLCYTLVSFLSMCEGTSYVLLISYISPILCNIQLIFLMCEAILNRKYVARYLNLIGPNICIQNINNYSQFRNALSSIINLLLNALVYVICFLPLCYSLDDKYNNGRCIKVIVFWLMINYLIPRILDDQHLMFIKPLIKSYKDLNTKIKSVVPKSFRKEGNKLQLEEYMHGGDINQRNIFKSTNIYSSRDTTFFDLLTARINHLELLTNTYNLVCFKNV